MLAPNALASERRTTSDDEVGRVRRSREAGRRAEQPDGRGRPLPDPVGGEAPREQGQHRPRARAAEQDADLRQAQVVAVAEHRREHRQPRVRGRLRGLHERAGREHDPAPAHCKSGPAQRELVPARAALEAALRGEEALRHPPCAAAPRFRCPRGSPSPPRSGRGRAGAPARSPARRAAGRRRSRDGPSVTSSRSPGSRSKPPPCTPFAFSPSRLITVPAASVPAPSIAKRPADVRACGSPPLRSSPAAVALSLPGE